MGTSILIGLLCLGFSGFFIKLLSMPVNSILGTYFLLFY